MIKFLIDMFSARSGQISSKRVCGFLGWIVCLIIACFATSYALNIPSFVDTILITSAGLLGLDSVTLIWKKPEGD